MIGPHVVLTLRRMQGTEEAVFGHLEDTELRILAVTLELPWRHNAHGVSCIPEGTYTGERYHSPKHGYDLFRLIDVPDRSDVELHIGNTVDDTEGCVLLGTEFGMVRGKHGITGSKSAFDAFMRAMRGVDRFDLIVVNSSDMLAAA